MLLAVNVGNTQTKLGVFEGEEIRGRWRTTTEAFRTEDEVGVSIEALLALRGMALGDVEAMVIASDVPDLARSYRRLGEDLLKVPFFSVSSGLRTDLKNRYDDPKSVGSDRIVNSVAVVRLYGAPAIIVDFGTATTVEAVDRDASYLGGAIMPGVYISLDALAARAAKLLSVDLEEKVPDAIATNTPDSIRSGFIYGYAGAVDALIRRMEDELGSPEKALVVATGGPAPVIVPHCREIQTLDPDLTLKGLRVLYEMNA